MMTKGLYLKANLELPCWDDVGEDKILRQLDSVRLQAGEERDISRFAALRHIRQAFRSGQTPYPGLCERCAVLGHGPRPEDQEVTSLDVLHVEPSFLCHLSCPQCIPSKLRRSLKAPPYHLDPEDYDAFLAELKREGVEEIRLVIFEGRGDPLNNRNLGELVRLTKQHYPRSMTSITTHGNFPYRSWILESGLDLLRLSVDGAFQENYAKYRVGGRLDVALKLMRDIRDQPRDGRRRPSVEWKYILFEWNDSDAELAEAGRLARELGVGLRFCRTHSEGRSQRYRDEASVLEMIRRLAPHAAPDLVFQLKPENERLQVDAVRDDQILAQMHRALSLLDAHDRHVASVSMGDAVRLDPGAGDLLGDGVDLMSAPGLASRLTRPATAISLAAYASRLGLERLKRDLLARFVALAPNAPGADDIAAELRLHDAADALARRDRVEAETQLALALEPRLGGRTGWLDRLAEAARLDHPGLVMALANIACQVRDATAASALFRRYLELAPDAADAAAVRKTLHQLTTLGRVLAVLTRLWERGGLALASNPR